ncbi:hypothetical protein EO087_00045 [Dyella sp. M7H15-1]|uniref:hypothetical protein n=1 Tax=Dyella sp. M7H15-1 TaxID=2501295 RepID=UPI0010051483|nr:hypothetical protein [Dyella sp. M7H15-1]QAU22560.1 hypothetical protein EO087_00045 [Dyella sp. M7H15-1]
MSALPCIVSRDLAAYQHALDRESAYQARIEAKVEQLRAEYREDGDILWESLGNVTARTEAKQQPALIKVLRDGGHDAELAATMRCLRDLVLAECDDTANIRAEGVVQREDEDVRHDRAEARAEARAYELRTAL